MITVLKSGPVAQLGARFHGMEEVIGSIPIRSTNFPHIPIDLTCCHGCVYRLALRGLPLRARSGCN